MVTVIVTPMNLENMNLENHLVPHTETRTQGSHPFKFRVLRINKVVYKFSYFPQTIKESNLDEFLMCV